METVTYLKDGVLILEPSGKIIGEAIPKLRQILLKYVDTTQTPSILINFARVHKMDSAGLGVFITAYNMARAKGGRIGIINVDKHIKNLIVRSRLIRIFERFDSEEASLSALSESI
ncbi:STAS domain-containing protein [Candidatus Poribacteria bacterium]|nr:STAS domain-containing protein [Candidatus Poribacteria bacterium]